MFTVYIDDSGTSPDQQVAIATAVIIPTDGEGPPKISAVIIAAAGLQQFSRGDGRVDLAFGISEANHVSGFRKCGLLSAG